MNDDRPMPGAETEYPGATAPQGSPYAPAPAWEAAPQNALALKKRAARSEIFRCGLLIGAAFLGHLLLSRIYIYSLRGNENLRQLYLNDLHVQYLLDTLYTIVAVGLPFLIVWCVLRRTRFAKGQTLPLGKTYPGACAGLLVFAALGVCLLGSLLTNWFAAFADSVGLGFNSYYQALEGLDTPEDGAGLLLFFLRTALVPAFVEELCFRGVILQPLRRYGDWFAVGVTAFLFGMMHANMTQMPFAILAGVAMGYAAVVTGSLWTSILIHFLNNFISCVSQIALTRLPEGRGMVVDAVLLYAPLLLGAVLFAVYASKHRNCLRLYPWEEGKLEKKARFFLLAPTLLVALCVLAFNTLCDVKLVSDALAGGIL